MSGLLASRSAPIWLLDFDVGGRVYRYATKRVSVTAANGQTYLYQPGLVPPSLGVTRTLGTRTVGLEVHSGEDWRKIEARGIGLEQRPCILRLYFDGDTLEQCDVYAEGISDNPATRGIGEPLTLDLVEDIGRTARHLPNEQAVCNDDTWPVAGGSIELGESAIGVAYPVPIGFPGDHPKPGASVDIAEPAYHAPWCEYDPANSADKFLIALGTIDAAQATLYEDVDDTVSSADISVSTTTDGRGVTVSYLGTGILNGTGARPFFVGFRDASGYGGGVKSPYTGDVLRGAGEVARFLLDYFTDLQVDAGRFAAHGDWLDRFKIDGVLGEAGPELVTSWMQKHILDVLPVMLVDGDRGLYLAPLRWDAQKHHRVAHIDIDAGHAAPIGTFERWRREVYNKFSVEYRPRWGKDYVSSRTLTSLEGSLGDALTAGVPWPPLTTTLPWMASAETDVRVAGSALLRSSQARFGIREWSAKLPACWHDGTAALILQYRALRDAWPKRVGKIQGGHHLSTLSPGDVVTISYEAEQLDEAVALVVERTTNLVNVELDLVILDSPWTPRLTS